MFKIDNTRKHFIPQFYLKGFVVPGKTNLICVLDKLELESGVQVRSITNVEVSRHAYSVEHDDMLQQREAMWGRMFSDFATRTAAELNEYIADRQSSMSFRLWMACFVIETKLRSRGLREELHEVMHEQWLKLQEFLRQREVEFAATYPEDYKKHNNYFPVLREITGASDERVYKAIMADPFLRSEEGHKRYTEIAEGSWRFDGTIKDRSYITSDIPSTLLTLAGCGKTIL